MTVHCYSYSAWKRYEKLYNEFGIEHERLTHEKPLDLFDHNGYAHVEAVSIPIDFILENFEELKVSLCYTYLCVYICTYVCTVYVRTT